MKHEIYLGDGVYCTFNGYEFTLDLRGQDNFTRIVMEPTVVSAFQEFVAACCKREAKKYFNIKDKTDD